MYISIVFSTTFLHICLGLGFKGFKGFRDFRGFRGLGGSRGFRGSGFGFRAEGLRVLGFRAGTQPLTGGSVFGLLRVGLRKWRVCRFVLAACRSLSLFLDWRA